jgi:D-sedoheptulose 7-phosphate isomerase
LGFLIQTLRGMLSYLDGGNEYLSPWSAFFKGDVLIAITTSGKSENVNRAIAEAKKRDMTVIGLLGKDGGSSKDITDIAIIVPSNDTQRIQEGHITIAHIICGILENEIFG